MSNMATVQRFFDGVNEGDIGAANDVIDKCYAVDCRYRGMGDEIDGIDGLKELVKGYITAFPDLKLSIQSQFEQNDIVVTRFIVEGVNNGTFNGLAATGKSVRLQAISIVRCVNGKIVEEWEEEEGVDTEEVGVEPVKNLGQPRRPLPPEDEEYIEGFDLESMVGLDQFGAADSGAALADVDTNYFTSLEQIELVDGTAGDAEDLLTSDAGVDRVEAEDDPLLQRVLNDYRKVMCFAGTYFTIELKAKSKGSPLVKSGILIIKRDAQNKLMEVILWKELQD